ncbi:MAG: enoyl-CoA hydratase/isomerase family protein, partial [Deltaproteobacteria bacterium]|nr:enoyl-CoA hydratase/isomerase family protein [Deltaproteobacteria bacterium]
MANELWAAVRRLRWDDEIRAVLLVAEGPIFSGGGDLQSFKRGLDEGILSQVIEELSATLNATVLALRRMEKPVISLIDGVCAGAGVGLALAADISIATEKALFVAGYIGIGAVPDGGSSQAVLEALGRARAADFFLSNGRIDGRKAAEIGLVSRFCASATAATEAEKLAAALSRGPARALALTKKILAQAPGLSLAEYLESERQGIIAASREEDFRIGVEAFLKKEPPRFQGSKQP